MSSDHGDVHMAESVHSNTAKRSSFLTYLNAVPNYVHAGIDMLQRERGSSDIAYRDESMEEACSTGNWGTVRDDRKPQPHAEVQAVPDCGHSQVWETQTDEGVPLEGKRSFNRNNLDAQYDQHWSRFDDEGFRRKFSTNATIIGSGSDQKSPSIYGTSEKSSQSSYRAMLKLKPRACDASPKSMDVYLYDDAIARKQKQALLTQKLNEQLRSIREAPKISEHSKLVFKKRLLQEVRRSFDDCHPEGSGHPTIPREKLPICLQQLGIFKGDHKSANRCDNEARQSEFSPAPGKEVNSSTVSQERALANRLASVLDVEGTGEVEIDHFFEFLAGLMTEYDTFDRGVPEDDPTLESVVHVQNELQLLGLGKTQVHPGAGRDSLYSVQQETSRFYNELRYLGRAFLPLILSRTRYQFHRRSRLNAEKPLPHSVVELDGATFRPELDKRSLRIVKNMQIRGSGELVLAGGSASERLYQQSRVLQQRRAKRIQQEEEKCMQKCSFQPFTRRSVCSALCRRNSGVAETRRSSNGRVVPRLPCHERLYTNWREQSEHQERMFMENKRRKEEEELSQCSFRPNIRGSVEYRSALPAARDHPLPPNFHEFVLRMRKAAADRAERFRIQENRMILTGSKQQETRPFSFSEGHYSVRRTPEVFSMLVEVGRGKRGKISVHEGEDPRVAVQSFCKAYCLNRGEEPWLTNILLREMDARGLLALIPEELQSVEVIGDPSEKSISEADIEQTRIPAKGSRARNNQADKIATSAASFSQRANANSGGAGYSNDVTCFVNPNGEHRTLNGFVSMTSTDHAVTQATPRCAHEGRGVQSGELETKKVPKSGPSGKAMNPGGKRTSSSSLSEMSAPNMTCESVFKSHVNEIRTSGVKRINALCKDMKIKSRPRMPVFVGHQGVPAI